MEDQRTFQKPYLARSPEGIVPSFPALFSSMDEDVIFGFYEPDAIVVSANGDPRHYR